MNNDTCKAHLGICVQVDHLEKEVCKLRKKYDRIMYMMVAALATLTLNLIGIIALVFHQGIL